MKKKKNGRVQQMITVREKKRIKERMKKSTKDYRNEEMEN